MSERPSDTTIKCVTPEVLDELKRLQAMKVAARGIAEGIIREQVQRGRQVEDPLPRPIARYGGFQ